MMKKLPENSQGVFFVLKFDMMHKVIVEPKIIDKKYLQCFIKYVNDKTVMKLF